VFNHCEFNAGLPNYIHDAILELLSDTLTFAGFEFTVNTSPAELTTRLRPDIIIKNHNGKKILLLDVKTRYDSKFTMDSARLENVRKYRNIANEMQALHKYKATVDTFVVCAFGAWDPRNELPLRNLGLSNVAIKKLAVATSAKAISISHAQWRQHDKRSH
jgi:hypothetical protein